MSILLLLLCLLIPVPSWALTYYVDRATGNDSRTPAQAQSESTPWQTIVKCVDTVAGPGNTCLVKNGNYPETNHVFGLSIPQGGTTGNPFTLKAYPGHNPTIRFDAVKDFMILGTHASPMGPIVIEGMEISNCSTVMNLHFVDHLVLRNNYLHHCSRGGILGEGWGVIVEGNTIAHIGDTAIDPHGMYVIGKDWIIRNNMIYGSAGYGIQIKCANITSTTNTNYEGCAGWKILNNTIAYNGWGGVVVWDGAAETDWTGVGDVSGVVFGNNIFYENAQDDVNFINGVQYLDVGAPNHQITNNIHYNSRGAPNYHTPNTGQYTLVNDSQQNPMLVNAPATRTAGHLNTSAQPNLHLTTNSTNAIDTGLNYTSFGVTSDFDGDTRPQGSAFDRGADEFLSTTPTPLTDIRYTFVNGSGNTVTDDTGNGNTGTLVNGMAWTTGKTGFGITASAASQHLAIPIGSGIDPSGQSMTIILAVRPFNGSEGQIRTFFGSQFVLGQRLNLSRGTTWDFVTASTATTGTISVTAGWTHLCLNLNSTNDTATLYVNGVLSVSATYPPYTVPSNFRLGLPQDFDDTFAPIGDVFDDFAFFPSVQNCPSLYSAWNPGDLTPPAAPTGVMVR